MDVVPHGQRGASPWRGGRDVGIDQLKEPQFLGHGMEERRCPELSGLYGVERGHCPLGGSDSPLDTDVLHDPLLRPQIDLLDNARLALDTGGADPVEIRSSFFPLGNETWHTGRVIGSVPITRHRLKRSPTADKRLWIPQPLVASYPNN